MPLTALRYPRIIEVTHNYLFRTVSYTTGFTAFWNVAPGDRTRWPHVTIRVRDTPPENWRFSLDEDQDCPSVEIWAPKGKLFAIMAELYQTRFDGWLSSGGANDPAIQAPVDVAAPPGDVPKITSEVERKKQKLMEELRREELLCNDMIFSDFGIGPGLLKFHAIDKKVGLPVLVRTSLLKLALILAR
jgi:hypothetical protein